MKNNIIITIVCMLISSLSFGGSVNLPKLIDNNIKLSKQVSPGSRQAYRSDREDMQRHIRRLESQIIDLKYDRDQQQTEIATLNTQQSDVDVLMLDYMKNYLALIEYCEMLLSDNNISTPSSLSMIKRDIVDAIRDLGFNVEGDNGNEPDNSTTES